MIGFVLSDLANASFAETVLTRKSEKMRKDVKKIHLILFYPKTKTKMFVNRDY